MDILVADMAAPKRENVAFFISVNERKGAMERVKIC